MWWREPEALVRFVSSLVAAELIRARPGETPPPRPWPPTLKIGAGGLDADSLELLTLASALAQALHFHRSGLEDYLLARPTLGEWAAIAGESLNRFSAEVSFATSGSTGAPKSCVHTLAELEEEAAALATVIGARRRVVAAVPCHHIYGFIFTLLLPRLLGASTVEHPNQSVVGLIGGLAPGDLVIGHPEFWRAAARATPRFPADVIGVTSTAPCDPAVLDALKEGGLARTIEVYGSSETAGVGWRDDPRAPYRLFLHWRRGAQASEIIRVAPSGDARIVTLGDRLDWSGDDLLRPEGRLDGAVQVGGVNVFPTRIAEALTAHPAVAAAAVRLMRPDEGTRLKAFVVPVDPTADLDLLRKELNEWASSALAVAERPRAFRFGARLPTGPLGKPTDWELG
ncbi:MAG: AMP-binding protein [Elsteraceae bacterium]